METYPIKNEAGLIYAFEIENIYISLREIATILSSLNEISNIKIRKPFQTATENQIEFECMGKKCIVWEPYGDSSRYWIGAKDVDNKDIDVTAIEASFKCHQPFFLRKILGDILSLKFLAK